MSTGSAGYDGPEDDKFVGEQRWQLKQWISPITGKGVMGVVEVYEDSDRSVRGYVEFKDEDEFNWLKRRIEGGRKVG